MPAAEPNNTLAPFVAEVVLQHLGGEPRVRDLDLAERLGFDRPRDIRKLIERNMAEIEAMGICATVAQNHGGGRGRPSTEYHLNEEQALLVATLSSAPQAAAVRAMLIRVFVAYRRGQIAPPALDVEALARLMGEVVVKAIVAAGIAPGPASPPPYTPPSPFERLAPSQRRVTYHVTRDRPDWAGVTEMLAEDFGTPRKNRRSLQRQVLERLTAHCAVGGMRADRDPRSGTWIFPRAQAVTFIRDHCGDLIADHIERARSGAPAPSHR